MENNTEDKRFMRALRQATSLPTGIAVFLSTLNILLSVTASLSNALMLIALQKGSTLPQPTKLLFRCLAVTDLCVGLIIQPLFVSYLFNAVTKIDLNLLFYIVEVANSSGFILCGVSISTWTAISVDRLLVLLLEVSYKHVVTLRRVRAAIICFWLTGVSGGFLYSFWNQNITHIAGIVYSTLCVCISVVSYTKIFITMRKHQSQVQDDTQREQPKEGGISLNMARYKKTVSSIAKLQFTLVVCYVPFAISSAMVEITRSHILSADIVWFFALTLVYLNSSLNPILYCCLVREVTQAVKETVGRCSRSFS